MLLARESESQGFGGGELVAHGKGEACMGLWLRGWRGAGGAEWPEVGAHRDLQRWEGGWGLRAGPAAAVAPGAPLVQEAPGAGNSVACGPQPPWEYCWEIKLRGMRRAGD